MSRVRQLTARRGWSRLRWAIPAGAVVVTGAVLAGTVLASAAAPVLPRRTPAQLLAAMRHAVPPEAMTAVISETANLGIPALPAIGGARSSEFSAISYLSGTHSIDLWYAGPAHLRIAVPVSFGESDLRVDGSQVWLWNSQSQTATHVILPAPHRRGAAKPGAAPGAGPFHAMTPIQAADRLLALVGPTTRVTLAGTAVVAGRSVYQLAVAPRSHQSLIGRILVSVDAKSHLPLEVRVFSRGSSSPAYQIGFSSLTIGKPASSNFSFTPPPGAKVRTVRPSALSASGAAGLPGKQVPMRLRAPSKPGAVHLPGRPAIVRHGKYAWVRVRGSQVWVISHKPGAGKAGAWPPTGWSKAPVAAQASSAGTQTVGSGWLAVHVFPVAGLLGLIRHGGIGSFLPIGTGGMSAPVHAGTGHLHGPLPRVSHGAPIRPAAVPGGAQQAQLALGLLLKAMTKVHGSWGSGLLLRTKLVSVLITSKGQALIGAVSPAVLYADAAKLK